MSATDLIARLNLQPLPHEGGFFARTWTSRETLPDGRPLGTAIYFLLTPDGFSALHRLDADELWHFHSGDPVEHLQLSPSGSASISRLGPNPASGEIPQLTVPAGSWQGARLAQNPRLGWALLTCTMSPGWTDSGFELGSRADLHALYPAHMSLISALTRTA